MPLTKEESKKVQQLAQEGKQTKRIFEDHFPHLSYGEIAAEVRAWGEKSALGRMRMITRRINDMAMNGSQAERLTIAKEIHGLTKHLYYNHKNSRDKLTKIREALEV
jgi:hypothetical protein